MKLLENNLKRLEKQKGFDTLNSLKKDLDMIEKIKGSTKEEKIEKKQKMSKKKHDKQK